MKKRLLLAVLVGAATLSAMAQSPVKIDHDPALLGTDPSNYAAHTPVHTMQGKTVVTDWYNFIDASDATQGGAINYKFYSNIDIWPDSNVKLSYGDGNGGNILLYVGRHNTGQMFDPKSFYYTDVLSEHNPYNIDSLMIAYRYFRGKPADVVDTLEIQVFYDDAILKGTFQGSGEKTAWIKYDRNTGKGANAKQEWRVLLTNTDTSWGSYSNLGLALPSTASIGRDGLFAATFRYIPGYSYSLGDTLSHTWDNPPVVNQLNEFQILRGFDEAKTAEDSYNHALDIVKSNKYDAQSGWANEFIPGDAWNGDNEYCYVSVHLTSPNVGMAPIKGGLSRVFPNPSNGQNVSIAFTTTRSSDVTVEVFDLQGRKVQTAMNTVVEAGQQIAKVNTDGLNAGVYIYTIKAEGQVISGKITVTN
ncbi:MAG: T9SS type A sorting domain-containing protein [Bacteroidetes bacterium]|nr:T9SS type A sorting domain-containing protein [Bacteroidota bacterium]